MDNSFNLSQRSPQPSQGEMGPEDDYYSGQPVNGAHQPRSATGWFGLNDDYHPQQQASSYQSGAYDHLLYPSYLQDQGGFPSSFNASSSFPYDAPGGLAHTYNNFPPSDTYNGYYPSNGYSANLQGSDGHYPVNAPSSNVPAAQLDGRNSPDHLPADVYEPNGASDTFDDADTPSVKAESNDSGSEYNEEPEDAEDEEEVEKSEEPEEPSDAEEPEDAEGEDTELGPDNTEEHKAYWLGRFLEAFKDTSDVNDVIQKSGKPAQAVLAMRAGQWPDEAIEAASGVLYDCCCNRQNGNMNVPGTKVKNGENYDTFEDRLEQAVYACRRSKAVCKSLLDPPFVARLADRPSHELHKKSRNSVINGLRNQDNSVGRAVKRAGLTIEDIKKHAKKPVKESSSDDGSLDPAATPSTVARTPRTPATPKSKKRGTSSRPTGEDSTPRKIAKNEDSNLSPIATRSRRGRLQTLRCGQSIESSSLRRESRIGSPPKIGKMSPAASSSLPRKSTAPSPSRIVSARIAESIHPERFADFADPPSPEKKEDTRDRYKKVICTLLGVSAEFAPRNSLKVLRTYARGYNSRYGDGEWTSAMFPRYKLKGHKLRLQNGIGNEIDHIAMYDDTFFPLAKARGDIHPNGTFSNNPQANKFFKISDDAQLSIIQEKALGMTNNVCNLLGQEDHESPFDDED